MDRVIKWLNKHSVEYEAADANGEIKIIYVPASFDKVKKYVKKQCPDLRITYSTDFEYFIIFPGG